MSRAERAPSAERFEKYEIGTIDGQQTWMSGDKRSTR